MGFLASATTIYARAYLTTRGREYLFNNNNIRFNNLGEDLFRIKYFALGDPDVNYRTSPVLPEGFVPDVSGEYDSCLKTALDYEQRNLLFLNNFDQIVGEDVEYTTDANGNILNVNVNLSDNDIPVGTDSNIRPNGDSPFDTVAGGQSSGGQSTGINGRTPPTPNTGRNPSTPFDSVR